MPLLGALLVALVESLVGVVVKILAIRFALQVAYVVVGAGVTYGVYSAIDAALQAWVIPSAPSYIGTALYLVNWGALGILVSLIITVETTVLFGVFTLRQLRMLAQH